MQKIFFYQVYTNLDYVYTTYRRVKKYKFSQSINMYVNPYHVKREMRFSSGAGTILHISFSAKYKYINIPIFMCL